MKPALWLMFSTMFASALSAADSPALPREPVNILVLGTFHFADAGLDSYEPEHEVDIFSATRQKELGVILDCLERFRPTKIGLERKWSENHELNEEYRSFLAGDLELSSNEIHQIGFRLAKRLNHERIFAIDAHRRFYEPYVDPDEYAEEHGQALNEAVWEDYYAGLYRRDDALKVEQSLIEHLLYRNSEDRIERGHGHYLVGSFSAGTGDEYPGVDAKIAWYNRNLRIFANVQRITEGPDDRILVVIGAGHLPILRHALEASPEYRLVEVKDVLSANCQ
ncbi:MAG TPA: DUF5694 domain-containing protein [Thermoanaerobaculia bacterium]|nr:DUF5694 domain-containing protein [Thermoanaerobaculia bacterium]